MVKKIEVEDEIRTLHRAVQQYPDNQPLKNKLKLYNAYMAVCCEAGENISFKKVQSVAFVSRNIKISVIIEEVD